MAEENKLGRPTDYKPEYVEALIEYFSEPPYKEVMKKIVTKDGDVVEVPEYEATDFKSLAGFAVSIGVHRETLLNWTKQYPDFFDAYKRAKEYQENFLLINGNKELIHPAFSIFTAKNIIGYRDRQPDEVDKTVINISNELTDKVAKARSRAEKK